MGTETIKLTSEHRGLPSAFQRQDLARLKFSHHDAAKPNISIWMMSLAAGEPVFPWWTYGADVDEDITKLSMISGITGAQELFEFLFLLQLKKVFLVGFYVIVPGNVKSENWSQVPERAQLAYQKGQACVYRLEASFGRKPAVNWVPFYQSQSLVKDPSSDVMTRFFNASKSDEPTTSLSFFSLAEPRRLPEVVNLLIRKDDTRSERLASLVDLYGVFSSPRDERFGTGVLAYAADSAALAPLKSVERGFSGAVEQVRTLLLADPTPGAVLKIISRLVAL